MGKCCQKTIPSGAEFAWRTPLINETSAPEAMRRRHLAPRGKCGLLKVLHGALHLVWEDSNERVKVTPEFPQIIDAERFHHLEFDGPVEFQVEFFTLPAKDNCQKISPASCCCASGAQSADAPRPGEAYAPR